jgi:hypothetical protein
MNFLVVTLALVVSALLHASEDKVFSWASNPAASYPHSGVQGNLHFNVSPRGLGKEPIRRCVLLHGYGVSQAAIDFLVHRQGTGARLFGYLIAGKKQTPVTAFARGYYGGDALIERLRAGVCEEVVLVLQESAQSTAWEMTQRTEAFLQQEGCPEKLETSWEGQKSCAIFGHSLGGAVADLIMRRCSEKRSPSEGVCRKLSHIYTAASAGGGLGLGAVLRGAKIAENRELGLSFVDSLGLPTRLAPPWHDKFEGMKFKANAFDVFSDVIPNRTNPTWFAFSPLAKVDDDTPAILRFSRKIDSSGWFQGKFSASGSNSNEIGTPNVKLDEDAKAKADAPSFVRSVASRFSDASEFLQEQGVEPIFESGLKAIYTEAKGDPAVTAALASWSWENYRKSDGLVEADIALRTCRQFNSEDRQVDQHCLQMSLNHFSIAGYAREAVDHIVSELSQ